MIRIYLSLFLLGCSSVGFAAQERQPAQAPLGNCGMIAEMSVAKTDPTRLPAIANAYQIKLETGLNILIFDRRETQQDLSRGSNFELLKLAFTTHSRICVDDENTSPVLNSTTIRLLAK